MNSYDHIYGSSSRYEAARTIKTNNRRHLTQAPVARIATDTKNAADDKFVDDRAKRIIASLPSKFNNAVIEGKQALYVMPVDGFDVTQAVPPLVKKVMAGLAPFGVNFKIERRPDIGYPASHYLVARW